MFFLLSAVGWLAIIVGVIILIIIVAVIAGFNNLVSKRNRVQDAWAQIDVQLKRRYDLIPNLINSVKGYMKYEKAVLTQVTQLRSSIISGSTQDKAQANNQLSQALKTIFAVAENYPDLKASQNFKQLQDELTDTEDKISFVRTSYNDYVLDYNNAIQTFPGNVFADWFHFQKDDFFQAPAGENVQEPVKVDFSDVNLDDSKQAAKQQPAAAATPKKGKKQSTKKTKSNNSGTT
jgi:LemA protein